MPTYHKLITGTHTRWEVDKKNGRFVRYKAGSDEDTFTELTEAELANLGGRVRATSIAPKSAEGAAPAADGGVDLSQFSEMTAREPIDVISELESPEDVNTLKE